MKTVYILMIATHIGESFDFDVWGVYSDVNEAIKAAEEKAELHKSRGFYEVREKSDPFYVKKIKLRKRNRIDILKEIMVQEETVI